MNWLEFFACAGAGGMLAAVAMKVAVNAWAKEIEMTWLEVFGCVGVTLLVTVVAVATVHAVRLVFES